MSLELEYFPKAIPYFRDFVNAHLHDFYEHMLEYRTYPSGGYSSFYRDNEVRQVLINIYLNLEETFSELKIPEKFPSPKALARAWNSFLVLLKNEDQLFNDVYNKYGGKDEDLPYPVILTAIDADRRKVIDLLEHIISLDEVKIYLEKTSKIDLKSGNIIYNVAPSRIFDVVIVTAIYTEYEQVIQLVENGSIPPYKDPSRTTYFQGELQIKGGKKIKVLVTCANQMGMTSAASLTSKLISRFAPKLVTMVGIAAGITGEIGDVMIPDILWDYGSGKSTLETKTKFGFYKVHEEKFTSYRFPITIKQDLIAQLIRITRETDVRQKTFELGNELTFEGKAQNINVHIGPFVSGSAVIANDKILAQIKNQDGKLVGFDMEAFAVAYACKVSDITPQPTALILKSISDYGNKKKSHPDKENHQKYAAFTSANLLFLIIKNHPEMFDLN